MESRRRVTKIKSFDGDDTCGWGPRFANGTAPYFVVLIRNKRDLVPDLSGTDGIALLFESLERIEFPL